MEFEHLQLRYSHVLDKSRNQPEQTISNNQCSNDSDVTKRYRVIGSNVQNPELNKLTPPLNKAPSCEGQLTEIRKKYHNKYIAFTNNKQVLPNHPFPKGTCLIVGDSKLIEIDENRLKSGKHKVKVRYFLGACTDDIYDYMKPLLRKLPHYIILHSGTNDSLDNPTREILDKILKLKTHIQKELPNCKITLAKYSRMDQLRFLEDSL